VKNNAFNEEEQSFSQNSPLEKNRDIETLFLQNYLSENTCILKTEAYLGGLSSTLENRKLSRRLEKKRKFSIRCLPRGTVFHTGKPEVEQKIGEEEEVLHPGEALTQASPVQYTIMELRIGLFPSSRPRHF
jgi:hypothetical protein